MPESTFIKTNPDIFRDEKSEYFDPKYWQSIQAIDGYERGRGTTWFLRHNDHALVLRHFYRGGFMSRFNRDRYIFSSLDNTRAFKEFSILERLYKAGLPVPEPAGARVIKTGKGYTADLITRRIPRAQDLLQILQLPASNELLRSIAETIAKLHKFGVLHPDLNIQNILVDQSGKVWVIDFDQAKITSLKKRHRYRMIERLERSFIKEHVRHGIIWTEKNWAFFRECYKHAYSHQ